MKVYHLVVFAGLLTLIAPKLGAGITVLVGAAAVVLWVLAALLGFPGWRANKPRQ